MAVMTKGEIRYVRVPVTFAEHSPLDDVVEMAFPADGVAPVDFFTAEWTPGQTWSADTSVEARILVGDTISLDIGVYDVWVRITDGSERVMLNAGELVVQSGTAPVDISSYPVIEQDISIVQGASFVQYFFWRGNNIPQSLSGYTAKFAVSRRRGSTADPILEVTSESGKIVVEPLDTSSQPQTGVVLVQLSPADTELLTKASNVYDLWVINSDQTQVTRIFQGNATANLQASESE